jgi:hypothetical protein
MSLNGLLCSKEVYAFDKLCTKKSNIDNSILEKKLTDIYTLLEPKLLNIKNKYSSFLKRCIKKKDKKRVKIILSVKSLDSLKSKVIEREKSLSDVKDLVRATILLNNSEDVKKLYKDIVRKKSEVIRCSEKKRGGDSLFGYYGSFHIVFCFQGLNVELQIMTRKLWSYKENLHELYDKYRDEQSPTLDKSDLHISKLLFSKGNQKQRQYKHSEIRQNYKTLIRHFKK